MAFFLVYDLDSQREQDFFLVCACMLGRLVPPRCSVFCTAERARTFLSSAVRSSALST